MDEAGDEIWWKGEETNDKYVHMQQFFGPYGNNPKGFIEFTRTKTSKTFTSNKISKKTKRKENHIEYFDHKIIEQLN